MGINSVCMTERERERKLLISVEQVRTVCDLQMTIREYTETCTHAVAYCGMPGLYKPAVRQAVEGEVQDPFTG